MQAKYVSKNKNQEDSVALFIKDAGNPSILRREEEISLAKNINYCKSAIIANLCRLPNYQNCVEEKLRNYDAYCEQVGVKLRKKDKILNDKTKGAELRLAACIETMDKINERMVFLSKKIIIRKTLSAD